MVALPTTHYRIDMSLLNGQFELLYPAMLIALGLVPLVVYLGRTSLLRLAGWQQRLGLTVRCLVIASQIFALCGIQWIATTNQPFVVFVVDRSYSVDASGEESATEFIEQATQDAANDQWAVLPFAGSAGDVRNDLTVKDAAPLESGTKIGFGLEAAAVQIPTGFVPRLVLLSDGNADPATTRLAVKSLKMPIDVVPLDSFRAPEAYVREVIAPANMPTGIPFDVEVLIHANHTGQGVVKLASSPGEDEVVDQKQIDLVAGENRVRFRTWLRKPGATTFAIWISEADDTKDENNSMRVSVAAHGNAQVLLVESEPDSARQIQRMLQAQGMNVSSTSPQDVSSNLDELSKLDLVVLSNISPAILSDRQQEALAAYANRGGGLVVIGGDQAFRPQALSGTKLQSILPVKSLEAAEAAKASLAMVLVVDRSKSMLQVPTGTVDKLALAKQAAHLSVDILQSTDKIGVIAFSDNTRWVSDLGPASGKRELKRKIDSITAEGGTNMYAALDKAYLALRRADAKLKHVIVLTDGVSVPGDFRQIASRMADEGITISTVAIGKDVAQALLTDISTVGRGRHYACRDPDNLPAIVARETRSASETVASEQPFRPQMIHVPPRLAELKLDSAPPLGGYAETTPKQSGQLVLTSETGDPLLVWWRQGAGKVVAFTSDAQQRWSTKWLEWPQYGEFWLELAHLAMRTSRESDHVLQVESQGNRARVVLDVTDEGTQFSNGLNVKVEGFEGSAHALRQTVPGRYEATLPAGARPSSGEVSIYSSRSDASQSLPLAIVSNYPAELQLKPTNETLLRQVAELSGGRYDIGPQEVFNPDDRTAQRITPLWPYFTAIALVLFLMDVTLRRVDLERWFGSRKV